MDGLINCRLLPNSLICMVSILHIAAIFIQVWFLTIAHLCYYYEVMIISAVIGLWVWLIPLKMSILS